MKNNFHVRKGLEKPLLIKGVQVEHYYLLLAIGTLIIFLSLSVLYGWLDDKTSTVSLVVQEGLLLGAFMVIYQWFKSKAIIKKYIFSKEISQLSNRDILNYLR